jgi:hypothetical protein
LKSLDHERRGHRLVDRERKSRSRGVMAQMRSAAAAKAREISSQSNIAPPARFCADAQSDLVYFGSLFPFALNCSPNGVRAPPP